MFKSIKTKWKFRADKNWMPGQPKDTLRAAMLTSAHHHQKRSWAVCQVHKHIACCCQSAWQAVMSVRSAWHDVFLWAFQDTCVWSVCLVCWACGCDMSAQTWFDCCRTLPATHSSHFGANITVCERWCSTTWMNGVCESSQTFFFFLGRESAARVMGWLLVRSPRTPVA